MNPKNKINEAEQKKTHRCKEHFDGYQWEGDWADE